MLSVNTDSSLMILKRIMSPRPHKSFRHSREPYKPRMRSIQHDRDTKFAHNWNNDGRRFELRFERNMKKSDPNNILRFRVLKSYYQVTTDALYYVFSQYGKVLRIVLFMTSSLPNGMIEFDAIEGNSSGGLLTKNNFTDDS